MADDIDLASGGVVAPQRRAPRGLTTPSFAAAPSGTAAAASSAPSSGAVTTASTAATDTPEATPDNLCKTCERPSGDCKDCAGCEAVHYCSTACQEKDWTTGRHREACSRLRIILLAAREGGNSKITLQDSTVRAVEMSRADLEEPFDDQSDSKTEAQPSPSSISAPYGGIARFRGGPGFVPRAGGRYYGRRYWGVRPSWFWPGLLTGLYASQAWPYYDDYYYY